MITETYREIEIVLLEEENKWRFTANGRERTAPSLPKAKEFIDNALDKVETGQQKPFERIPVYFLDIYPNRVDSLERGEVTSLVGKDYRSRLEVWAFFPKRGRRKVTTDYLCVDSPANVAIFEQLKAIEKEQAALAEKFRVTALAIERVNLED